jgi:excisionase family DNA binding protein
MRNDSAANHSGANILTVSELASYFRVHQATIYRLLKSRELPAFRVGSDWRFDRETIDEWIRSKHGQI